MFRFTNKDAMSCAAGEAILFDFQDCDFDDIARPLASANRSFQFQLYDASGTTYCNQPGGIQSDATGEFARFILPGTVSDSLRDKGSLFFDLTERLDDGDEQILTGSLTITRAAALTVDNDRAPKARYIQRVLRRFDPIYHSIDPLYDFTFASLSPVAQSPLTSMAGSMNFSNASNSGLIAMF